MSLRMLLRNLAIALIASFILSHVAMPANEVATKLDRIKDEGRLVIAMEGDWAPWTYHDASTNELIGFDTELGKAIAAKLEVEAEFIECPWDDIFAGIIGDRYDLAINGIEWTQDRSDNYLLSDPYIYISPVLITRNDNDEISAFGDLNGKLIAYAVYSSFYDIAESLGAMNIECETANDAIALLIDGRIDAAICNADSFAEFMCADPGAPIKIFAKPDDAYPVVMAMKNTPENETLLREINKALNELRADGMLGALSTKYFGYDLTSAPSGK